MVGGVGSGVPGQEYQPETDLNNEAYEIEAGNESGDAVPDATNNSQVEQALEEAGVDLILATDDPEAAIQTSESEGLSIPAAEAVEEAFVGAVPLPETSDDGETSQTMPAEISLEAAGVDGTVRIEAADAAADRGPKTEDRIAVAEGEMDPDPVDVDEGSVDLESLISAVSDASGIPESEIEEEHLDGPVENISTDEDYERSGIDNLEQSMQDQEDATPVKADPLGSGINEGDRNPDLMDRPQPGSSRLDGTDADRRPQTEDREMIIDSNDREVIIDSNDGTSTIGIIDSNDSPTSGAETVMIDTVPLPEKDGGPRTEDREAIIDSNDGTGTEAIGTWPTPDAGADPGPGTSPNLPGADLTPPDQSADFEAAIEPETDQSEDDQLANLDIQNTLQHQQQLINMLQGISSALQNTRDAIDRKADDGSYQADEEGDSGPEIKADPLVPLSAEPQDSANQGAQLQEMMSSIIQNVETSADQLVQNLKDGDANPDSSGAEVALQSDQDSDSTSITTEFEDFDQKANQLFNILSTVLKSMQEAESVIKRNLDGGEQENGQPEENPTESSPAIERIFRQYNRQLAEIVPLAETALGDNAETETGQSSGINPDYPGTNPAGDIDPGLDQAGYDPRTTEDYNELEENNRSEVTAENTDLGTDPSQTLLNAIEAELSAAKQDMGEYTDRLEAKNNALSALREDIQLLSEELDSWPDDGSTREITYSDWVKNEDGSYSEIQYTKTMTKAEAQNLLAKLEALADTMGDGMDIDMLNLQEAMNKQAQLMQMMSNIQKNMHDVAMALIQNLK